MDGSAASSVVRSMFPGYVADALLRVQSRTKSQIFSSLIQLPLATALNRERAVNP